MTDLRFQPGSIEQLRIDELRPYERNPRTHSDDQVAKLAASLVEFGWTMPVLVNDEREVIAGHGRILAARRLGLDAVPVIRLAHLTPEQARAYRIADNKLALDAGWDEELLAAEFHELNGAGYDLGLTGFSAEELVVAGLGRAVVVLFGDVRRGAALVPGLCRPVWQRFVATAQAIGALPSGQLEAEWTAPRFEAVDPLKDVQADILAVRAGLMTLKEAIARQGYDPGHVLAEIGATNAELDALGIVLDTDPRKATKTGAAKPATGDEQA